VQYFKDCLKDEAAKVIGKIKLTAQGYSTGSTIDAMIRDDC
jgi:hypothetical protein